MTGSRLPVLVAACAALSLGAARAEPVTIEYWHINSATFGAGAVAKSIAAFQAEHPEITVVDRFQEGDYGGVINNLQAAIAAGNPPAVAQIGYNFRLFALDELPHAPIAELGADDPGYGNYLAGFADGILGVGQAADGTQHAVPYAISTPLLYYNADLFRAAGLDPDAPPATWEEVRAAARAIRAATGEYGLGIQVSDSNNWVPQSMIESNGGRILDEEGRVVVDSPEAVQIFTFWQQLARDDQSLPVITDGEQQQAFLGGRLGMYIRTSASLGNFSRQAPFELRTAPFPTWGDQPRRVAAGGNALFIFAREPAQQRAAYEFVKFVTGPAGQTIWVQETGYLPVAKGLDDDPAHLQGYFAENPLVQASLAQQGDIVAWLPLPGPRGLEAEQALIEARQAILGGAEVEPALAAAAARMRELLGG
jgi:multiple sugar transport system substrate-binding protein